MHSDWLEWVTDLMTVKSPMMDSTADGEATTAAETEPAVAPRIDRCGAKSGGPLLLKCDEPAVIAVDVSGRPAADVGWHVAGRRVRKSSRYRPSVSGRRHTLTVLRVTDELEKGVWVMASNSAGEDSCLIAVKTYRGQGHVQEFSLGGGKIVGPKLEAELPKAESGMGFYEEGQQAPSPPARGSG